MMDTLTRHRQLVMLGVVRTMVDVDDDPWELDEVSAAIVDALDALDETRRRAPARIPKGFEGGGRFRRLSDTVFKALQDWAKGDGPDNPFDEVLSSDPKLRREQIRRVAKERGLTIRRGASFNEIANALLDDFRKGKGKGDGPDDEGKDEKAEPEAKSPPKQPRTERGPAATTGQPKKKALPKLSEQDHRAQAHLLTKRALDSKTSDAEMKRLQALADEHTAAADKLERERRKPTRPKQPRTERGPASETGQPRKAPAPDSVSHARQRQADTVRVSDLKPGDMVPSLDPADDEPREVTSVSKAAGGDLVVHYRDPRRKQGGTGAIRLEGDMEVEVASLGDQPDAVEKARARQADIESARRYADVASVLDELSANEASDAALLARLSAAGERHGITQEISGVLGMLRAGGPGDRDRARAMMRRVLEREGISQDGTAGTSARYDPAIHRPIGGSIRQGAPVEVVRPGFTLERDGERIRIAKAVVEEVDEPAPTRGELPSGADIEVVSSTRDLTATEIVQGRHLTPAGRRALDALGPAGHPRIAAIPDTEGKIREAYRMLSVPGGGQDHYVPFEDLRKLIGEQVPRAEVDETLRRMDRMSGVTLSPQHYGRGNFATRIPAALQLGGQDIDQIHIDDPTLSRPSQFPAVLMAEELQARETGGARDPLMALLSDAELRAEIDARAARDPIVARDLKAMGYDATPQVAADPLSDLRSLDPEAARDALDLRKIDGPDGLKALLREQGLPVSGRKRELVDRLVGHLHPGDSPTAPGRAEPKIRDQLASRSQAELMPIASLAGVELKQPLTRRTGGVVSAKDFEPNPDRPDAPFGERLRTRDELAREIAKAAEADPSVMAAVQTALADMPPPRPKRAATKPGAVRQGKFDNPAVPARAGTFDSPIRWAEGADPGWDESRTKRAQRALRAYGTASFEINASLRGEPVETPVFPPEQTAGHIEAIDDLMAASRTTEPMEQWRGLRFARQMFGDRLDGDLTGMEWSEGAYVSTSSDMGVSQHFATHGQGGMLMRVLVPEGVGAAQVKDSRGEAEALLERGLRLRIVADHGWQPGWGYRLVDVEVVPE